MRIFVNKDNSGFVEHTVSAGTSLKCLRDSLNAGGYTARVNSSQVGESTILNAEDTVVFTKQNKTGGGC